MFSINSLNDVDDAKHGVGGEGIILCIDHNQIQNKTTSADITWVIPGCKCKALLMSPFNRTQLEYKWLNEKDGIPFYTIKPMDMIRRSTNINTNSGVDIDHDVDKLNYNFNKDDNVSEKKEEIKSKAKENTNTYQIANTLINRALQRKSRVRQRHKQEFEDSTGYLSSDGDDSPSGNCKITDVYVATIVKDDENGSINSINYNSGSTRSDTLESSHHDTHIPKTAIVNVTQPPLPQSQAPIITNTATTPSMYTATTLTIDQLPSSILIKIANFFHYVDYCYSFVPINRWTWQACVKQIGRQKNILARQFCDSFRKNDMGEAAVASEYPHEIRKLLYCKFNSNAMIVNMIDLIYDAANNNVRNNGNKVRFVHVKKKIESMLNCCFHIPNMLQSSDNGQLCDELKKKIQQTINLSKSQLNRNDPNLAILSCLDLVFFQSHIDWCCDNSENSNNINDINDRNHNFSRSFYKSLFNPKVAMFTRGRFWCIRRCYKFKLNNKFNYSNTFVFEHDDNPNDTDVKSKLKKLAKKRAQLQINKVWKDDQIRRRFYN